MSDIATPALTKKDFTLPDDVRWCPGCGDYAILSAVQKTLPELNIPKENIVFISGIGCSSRFPYYMNTYGFHTIHGRAPAIATGVKVGNPDLSVWVITGDGDSMAIGGNHFIHALRRNVDLNILLFNNEIYGLTKGQYSPTSKIGKMTKSSPHGTVENSFTPGELALGAGATFFARVPDTSVKLLGEVIKSAAAHEGASLVEILQNCNIFNDKIHEPITNKETAADHQLILEHGKPMLFGKEMNKGIVLDGINLKVVEIGVDGITEDDILVHDAYTPNKIIHQLLIGMSLPEFPVALGVIRDVKDGTYNSRLIEQMENEKSNSKFETLDELFNSGNTWEL